MPARDCKPEVAAGYERERRLKSPEPKNFAPKKLLIANCYKLFFQKSDIHKDSELFVCWGEVMNRWVKIFISGLFAVFCASGVFAKSLSIQIIQNNPGQEKVWATSYLFEQNITDYFFDAGDIVSSSPIWISDTEEKNLGALKASLRENLQGGMDTLIRVELFYNTSDSSNPEGLLLENIKKVQWKAYAVSTGIQLFEGSAVPEKPSANTNNEIGLSQFAGLVAYKINNQMRY